MTLPRLIRASAASLCGPTRTRNEDMAVLGGRCVRDGSFAMEWIREGATRPFLAGVLDGLGGHQGGDQASALVAERLASTVWRWWAGCSAQELADGLVQTVTDAHRELTYLGREDPLKAGCGTTCTALVASAEALVLLHVGDSRCYRRRDGLWKQLTQDHSVVMPDGSGGRISRLIYALGADLPELPPDLVEDLTGKCFSGDRYLLVSDGVLAAAGSEERLEAAFSAGNASEVLELALANGGPDNATAVHLELVE
jgi:PPM family protein phosphatase